jgi:hypothetical protein
VSFRKLLLNRCQKEFEKEKEDEEKFVEKLKQLEGLPVRTLVTFVEVFKRHIAFHRRASILLTSFP